jgi:hypothetical protein
LFFFQCGSKGGKSKVCQLACIGFMGFGCVKQFSPYLQFWLWVCIWLREHLMEVFSCYYHQRVHRQSRVLRLVQLKRGRIVSFVTQSLLAQPLVLHGTTENEVLTKKRLHVIQLKHLLMKQLSFSSSFCQRQVLRHALRCGNRVVWRKAASLPSSRAAPASLRQRCCMAAASWNLCKQRYAK